ncbi:MAG: class I SAM-dependent methyltransferase [bacterium]|nr:class I SAM-dependent methyltransferase [bacterium]
MRTPDSTASAERPGAPVERPTDAIFAGIARRYDLINRVLAVGRDRAWRRSVIERLPPGRLLDLGAGTGAAVPLFGSRQVVALDPVSQMLDLNPTAARVVGRGEHLPFCEDSFDAVFSAFVFRNLDSVDTTLGEIARLLRPGGAAGVVGLTRPKGKVAASLHRAGSAVVVPMAGALVGAVDEYRYLHRSLDKLPPPEQLFADPPLQVDRIWRMGPLGFVYGAILTK